MKTGSRIVSDGMVLQRGKDFVLTGQGKNGTTVTAYFAGQAKKALCEDGSYRFCFSNLEAGGPYELCIAQEGSAQPDCTVKDILVGDVYLMSGQSNMELDIGCVYHSFEKEIDSFNCDKIRQFKVPVDYDFNAPLEDVAAGGWKKAVGEEKKTFGAIGFFMAKSLYEDVPIGLIQTAVPGCPIESFLKPETVSRFQNIELDDICRDREKMRLQILKEEEEWNRRIHSLLEKDNALKKREWKPTDIPLLLREKPDSQSGIYTFRKKIELEEAPIQDGVLKLGILIEADFTYVNGTQVGQTDYQYPPRRYTVPAVLLKKGENEITVKVLVTNGICRFWEEQEYSLTIDGKCYDLEGDWEYSKGAFQAEPFTPKTFFEYFPYGVYHAMTAPLGDYPVCGLLWYQGESNTGNPQRYGEKFQALVEQYREQLGSPKLPVYYVQLADYRDMNDPSGEGWAAIRASQEQSAKEIEHVYMIVSKDAGSATDLHPQNKKVIGERIAEAVRKQK